MADTLVNKNQLGEGVFTDDSLIFNRNLELDDVYSNDVILLANLTDNEHVSFPNASLVQNTGTIDETYTHFDSNSYQLNAYNTSTYGSGQKYLTYNLGNKLNDIDFTIDLWFYNRNVNQSTYNVIFELKNSNSSKSFMKVMGNGGVYMNGVYSSASSTTSLDTWHHIGLTYKVTSGEMKMFVDGTLKTQSTIESNAPNLLFGEIYLSSYCTSYSVCAIQGLRVRKGIHSNNDESFTVPTAFGTTSLTDKKSLNVAIDTLLNKKQDTLVSGSNIKTINNNSIVGSGNVDIDTLPSQSGQSGKFLTTDGTDASWATLSTPDNVYTKTNLLPGDNISFTNINTIDSNTLVLCHFDDNADNSSYYTISNTQGLPLNISYTTGKFDKGVKGTGNGGYVGWNDSDLHITHSWTLDFWIKKEDTNSGNYNVIQTYTSQGDGGAQVGFNISGNIFSYYIQANSDPYKASVDISSISSGEFFHVAFTYHTVAASGGEYTRSLDCFINGIKKTTVVTFVSSYIYTQQRIDLQFRNHTIDELRVSDIVRYTEDFTVPTEPYGETSNKKIDCTIDISGKQDLLVSGTNIKTINDTSILGSGNIDVSNVEWATYGTTTYSQVLEWSSSGKLVLVKWSSYIFRLYSINISSAFFGISAGTAYSAVLTLNVNNTWDHFDENLQTQIPAGNPGDVVTYTGIYGIVGSANLPPEYTAGVGIDITEESDETAVISSVGIVNQNNPFAMIKLWKGSQAEYDALVSGGTVDEDTFYIIVDESN